MMGHSDLIGFTHLLVVVRVLAVLGGGFHEGLVDELSGVKTGVAIF